MHFQMKSKNALKFNVSPEDIYHSLGQKTQTIFVLEKEVQDLKGIRQRYERVRDQKQFLQDKCRKQTRENAYLKEANEEKMESINKNCDEVKLAINSLEKIVKEKIIDLKRHKIQTQNYMNYNDQCQAQLKEKKAVMEDFQNVKELSRMEKERILDQELLVREDIKKTQYSQDNIHNSIEKVKNKIYKVQSFNRDLLQEQNKIAEALTVLEDENNSIDAINDDLELLVQTNQQKQREFREQIERTEMELRTKQIQKGRILREINEKVKLLKNQREKTKTMSQAIEGTFSEAKKLAIMHKQVKEEIDKKIGTNLQIEEINFQLKKDLAGCLRHLQNVKRNNKGVNTNIEKYKQTNKVVIKKLERPTGENWSSSYMKNGFQLCQTTDQFLSK